MPQAFRSPNEMSIEKEKEKIFAKELEGIVVKEDHSQSQTISLLPFVKNTSWLEGSNSPSFIYS